MASDAALWDAKCTFCEVPNAPAVVHRMTRAFRRDLGVRKLSLQASNATTISATLRLNADSASGALQEAARLVAALLEASMEEVPPSAVVVVVGPGPQRCGEPLERRLQKKDSSDEWSTAKPSYAGRTAALDFDGALRVLLGWIGQEVRVDVRDRASMGMVAHLHGTLGPACEVGDEATSEDEVVVLPVGPNRESVVILDRRSFLKGAGNANSLRLKIGSVHLAIAPCDLVDERGSSAGDAPV